MENHERTGRGTSHPTFLPESDPLRIFAVVAVIALHASAVRVVHLPNIETTSWWNAHVVDSLCRWAVPVFIMLSGALNLDPARDYSLARFYTKRFSRVVIPLLVWASIYYWWSAYSYHMTIDWNFIKESLHSGLVYNHLYFLFIIIGLYMFTPAIKPLTQFLPQWILWFLVLVLLYYTTTGTLFSHLPMNAFTRFLPYLLFFLIGYLLRSANFSYAWSVFFFGTYLAASLPIIYITGAAAEAFGRDDYRTFAMYSHFHILVFVQSISVYLLMKSLFSRERHNRFRWFLSWAAPASFGIYLIHVIFLNIIKVYTDALDETSMMLVISLEVIGVFIISTVIIKFILKMPYLRIIVGS